MTIGWLNMILLKGWYWFYFRPCAFKSDTY